MSARRPVITLLFSSYAVVVLGVIGSIVVRGWSDHGLMPRPSPLLRYECPAPGGAYALFFRHGRDQVLIRRDGQSLQGAVYDGRITWAPQTSAAVPSGLVLPREISYESASFIRVRDDGLVQFECTAQAGTP